MLSLKPIINYNNVLYDDIIYALNNINNTKKLYKYIKYFIKNIVINFKNDDILYKCVNKQNYYTITISYLNIKRDEIELRFYKGIINNTNVYINFMISNHENLINTLLRYL